MAQAIIGQQKMSDKSDSNLVQSQNISAYLTSSVHTFMPTDVGWKKKLHANATAKTFYVWTANSINAHKGQLFSLWCLLRRQSIKMTTIEFIPHHLSYSDSTINHMSYDTQCISFSFVFAVIGRDGTPSLCLFLIAAISKRCSNVRRVSTSFNPSGWSFLSSLKR